MDDKDYMKRCLQLAANGRGWVSPNPMVGAVVVCDGKIIGEGYHCKYGSAHAEVNAINSVRNKSLLTRSIIYVSLEPCSHYGKTPPCSQLIIDSHIPKVVVATLDPFPEVSGRGIRMLQNAGIEVILGVLEQEAKELNKEFFSLQIRKRPYIYLKWAQTKDGFIDKRRNGGDPIVPTPISNEYTKVLVHKRRSQVSAIMIATNTAVNDNPSLTTRFWYGKNPQRIILDRTNRIPKDYHLFDNTVGTLIFTETVSSEQQEGKTIHVPLDFDRDSINTLLKKLGERKIDSILVEGGASLLQHFIDLNLWDEAYIEIAEKEFYDGTKSPIIDGMITENKSILDSYTLHLKNKNIEQLT